MEQTTLIMLRLVIAFVVSIIVKYLVPYLKELLNKATKEVEQVEANLKETEYAVLVEYIETVVRAMKQTLNDNKLKKETAMTLISSWVKNHTSLELTTEEISTLIEGIYEGVKAELK